MSPNFRVVQGFFKGAAITMGSTLLSCALAVQVEKSAHRVLFWFRPQLYANVPQAYGLTEEQLLSVRHYSKNCNSNNNRQKEQPSLLDVNSDATIEYSDSKDSSNNRNSNTMTGEWNTFQKEPWLSATAVDESSKRTTTTSSSPSLTATRSQCQQQQEQQHQQQWSGALSLSNSDVLACSMTA